MEAFTVFATNKASSIVKREVIFANTMEEVLSSARCLFPKNDFDLEFKRTLFDANRWVRLINFIIDQTVINVVFVAGIQCLATHYYDFARQLDDSVARKLSLFLLAYFLYYSVLEGLLGVTIAKIITMTKVVSLNDANLTMPQVTIRTLCRLIPLEPFSFFSHDPGWHDKYSKTKVVYRRKGPMPTILKD